MKKRYLFMVAIAAFAIAIIQININQSKVQDQVRAIVAKDDAGQDVKPDLNALQQFVESHMQTSATVILNGSYKRAVSAAQAASGANSNGDVYAKAQTVCGNRSDSVTQAKCVSNYVASNSTPGVNPQPVAMPQISNFTKSFTGPNWIADVAGIGFLVGIGALAAAAYLLVL